MTLESYDLNIIFFKSLKKRQETGSSVTIIIGFSVTCHCYNGCIKFEFNDKS